MAVTGTIGAGKTTLAVRLARHFGAVHLASDDVRLSLSRKQRRSGDRVFAELHRRFEHALDQRQSVVLDSTGMSPRFRALLHAHREKLVHIHLRFEDERRFEERERTRDDRPAGPLTLAAFHRSMRVEFQHLPDIVVATDNLSPDEVFEIALQAIRPLAGC